MPTMNQIQAEIAAVLNDRHYTRLDLLNRDGTRNEAAFAFVLARQIEQETNLRLCIAAGLQTPRDISLGEVTGWRREAAAKVDQSLVSEDERARVAKNERIELEQWVRAMQIAAGKQREAMDAAYQIAAE
jgi:hypothetical protein